MKNMPFIKLIYTPLNYYFYDVNKNEIIKINENDYYYLSRILTTDENFSENYSSSISSLVKQGYLSNNRVKIIEHEETRTLKTRLNRSLKKMTLQLTQNCNLRCSYCVYSVYNINQRQHSTKRMSFSLACRAIDFFINHSIDTEICDIGFYGGEPLLEFNLIKKLVEYVELKYPDKRITYSLTTNGTLLDINKASFFSKKENFYITVSMDGTKEVHDRSRKYAADGKGTFEDIVNNLRVIKENLPVFYSKLSINMVLDPNVDFFKINNLVTNELMKELPVNISIIDDFYSSKKMFVPDEYTFYNEYNKFLWHMNRFMHFNLEIPKTVDYEMTSFMDKYCSFTHTNKLPNISAPAGPCIPGQLRLFVTTDGFFFPCERVSESSDVMKIGDLYSGFNYQNAYNQLNIAQKTESICKNCWAFNFCSICAKYADNKTSFSATRKIKRCIIAKKFAEQILRTNAMLIDIGEINI